MEEDYAIGEAPFTSSGLKNLKSSENFHICRISIVVTRLWFRIFILEVFIYNLFCFDGSNCDGDLVPCNIFIIRIEIMTVITMETKWQSASP